VVLVGTSVRHPGKAAGSRDVLLGI
jgi:hypothetical protein